MDQAAVAHHRLEAMEARTDPLRRVATPRRRPGSGGPNRRQPKWPLAACEQPGTDHRFAKPLLRLARLGLPRRPANRIIRRTAGYGPVCPVVWEGRSRKASPYPDLAILLPEAA